MKNWQLRLVGITLISALAFPVSPAWANSGTTASVSTAATATDGITHHVQGHSYHQRHAPAVHHSLEPVTADIQSTDSENSMHHWDIKSSVQVSRDALKDAYVASRDAYTKKLKKYAKCSERDAEKAVTAEHPGMKVQDIQLRNIRTSLVYMAIVADDEEKFLVVVDAGNGKVLMDKPMPTHHEKVFAEH